MREKRGLEGVFGKRSVSVLEGGIARKGRGQKKKGGFRKKGKNGGFV
jgi:hypothetical protein